MRADIRIFISSRYNDDEKDLVILRNYKKQYKDARMLFDREVEKVELIKEVSKLILLISELSFLRTMVDWIFYQIGQFISLEFTRGAFMQCTVSIQMTKYEFIFMTSTIEEQTLSI